MTSTAGKTFRVDVRLPETFAESVPAGKLTVDTPVATLGELITLLESRLPGFDRSEEEIYNFAVNGSLILHGESDTPIRDGDEVEMLVVFSGG